MTSWLGTDVPSQERYRILHEIGSGASAMVYLAEDRVLRRKLAIKRLHPHLLGNSEAVARFEKEALAVAKLSSHENIVKIFDAGSDSGRLFLAMEYIEGPSLDAVLRHNQSPLPNLVALEILRQILTGLMGAHRHKIIHRDIKPTNILLDAEGTVRLTDFGLAHLTGENSLTQTGMFLGTPEYMSPEQAIGQDASMCSDIFGTGLVFYRCLTGKPAFSGRTPQEVLGSIAKGRFNPPSVHNEKLLPNLLPLLAQILTKEPQDRLTAWQCLDSIEVVCEEYSLALGRKRVAEYLLDPEKYALKEERELGDLFLQRAFGARDKKKYALAQKNFFLAEKFGCVEPELKEVLKKKAGATRFLKLIPAFLFTGIFFLILDKTLPPKKLPFPPPTKKIEAKSKSSASPIISNPSIIQRNSIQAGISVSPFVIKPVAVRQTKKSKRVVETQLLVAPSQKRSLKPLEIMTQSEPSPTKVNAPESTWVWIKTNPPFTQVQVDGVDEGTTPWKHAKKFPGGNAHVRILRDDYTPMDTMISVTGVTKEFRFKLAPLAVQSESVH